MWLPSLYNCFSIWNKDLKQFMKMKLLYLAYYISKYFYHTTLKIFNRRNNMSRKCAVIKLRSVWRLKIILIEHNSNACSWPFRAGTFDIFDIFESQGKNALKMFCYHDIVTIFDSFLAKSQYLKILFMAFLDCWPLRKLCTGSIYKCSYKFSLSKQFRLSKSP